MKIQPRKVHHDVCNTVSGGTSGKGGASGHTAHSYSLGHNVIERERRGKTSGWCSWGGCFVPALFAEMICSIFRMGLWRLATPSFITTSIKRHRARFACPVLHTTSPGRMRRLTPLRLQPPVPPSSYRPRSDPPVGISRSASDIPSGDGHRNLYRSSSESSRTSLHGAGAPS